MVWYEDGGMIEMIIFDYVMMVEDIYVEMMIVEYCRCGLDMFMIGVGDGLLFGVVFSD